MDYYGEKEKEVGSIIKFPTLAAQKKCHSQLESSPNYKAS